MRKYEVVCTGGTWNIKCMMKSVRVEAKEISDCILAK
jgi:hypothetical protein